MRKTSIAQQLEAIKSIQSTINKSEKALAGMTDKGANTALLAKRLQALRIGLAMLEHVWNQKSHQYTQEDLAEASHVLMGLYPSLEDQYAKSKAGSPQRTFLVRRIQAFNLAVQAIDDFSRTQGDGSNVPGDA